MTGEEWDTHWYQIWSEATPLGYSDDAAAELADQECAEQFGPRPAEETAR